MKSTTLRRSNLSKEKMAVLEALRQYRSEETDSSPKVYVRPEDVLRENHNELDLLWQNFKFNDLSIMANKAPKVYVATGIVAGVLLFATFSMITFFAHKVSSDNFAGTNSSIPLVADKEDISTVKTEKYVVQSGDTIEKILIRFYGQYSKSSEYNIMQANNMTNPNKLSIGQELIIPMN